MLDLGVICLECCVNMTAKVTGTFGGMPFRTLHKSGYSLAPTLTRFASRDAFHFFYLIDLSDNNFFIVAYHSVLASLFFKNYVLICILRRISTRFDVSYILCVIINLWVCSTIYCVILLLYL